MPPETRSKRFNLSTNDDMGDHTEPKKRRKRLQFGQESYFLSEACMDRYRSRFVYGEVVPGRCIDLGFFNEQGFQFGKWFQDMNWVSVVSIKENFYPELARHFYANLSYDADKIQINSFVKGKEIMLNQESLSRILGIPNVGSELYEKDHKWVHDDVGASRAEAFRMILENPDLSLLSSKVNACHLKLEMRLLHHMVVHIVFPRKSNSNYVSDMDLLVVWHILKGKAFNLPFVLLSHMIACSEKKNAYLPYGMMLTLIFKHFNVSLEEEESKELKSSNIYNEVTLHKMGYVKSERGWCHKNVKVVAQALPSLEMQSEKEVKVSETQESWVLPTSIAIPAPHNSVNPSAEEGLLSEAARRRSVIQGICLLVRGMKEDMRSMTVDSRLDDLRRKIENLQSLVIQLGRDRHEKTIGDIFLLLEDIMGDMRTLRSKMGTFVNKIDQLLAQLNELLSSDQNLDQVWRECIEPMIADAATVREQNQDIIHSLENIRSEIQDFWDSLSSNMRLF